jgi:hypothetical protein
VRPVKCRVRNKTNKEQWNGIQLFLRDMRLSKTEISKKGNKVLKCSDESEVKI